AVAKLQRRACVDGRAAGVSVDSSENLRAAAADDDAYQACAVLNRAAVRLWRATGLQRERRVDSSQSNDLLRTERSAKRPDWCNGWIDLDRSAIVDDRGTVGAQRVTVPDFEGATADRRAAGVRVVAGQANCPGAGNRERGACSSANSAGDRR